MAEFQDVMRQAKRMCEQSDIGCTKCELNGEAGCPFEIRPDHWEDGASESIEHIVMDWAAKNPEPKYPTLNEAWKQLFPDAPCVPCPTFFFGLSCCINNCEECRTQPIPANIAEKLGFRPIEVKNDA